MYKILRKTPIAYESYILTSIIILVLVSVQFLVESSGSRISIFFIRFQSGGHYNYASKYGRGLLNAFIFPQIKLSSFSSNSDTLIIKQICITNARGFSLRLNRIMAYSLARDTRPPTHFQKMICIKAIFTSSKIVLTFNKTFTISFYRVRKNW